MVQVMGKKAAARRAIKKRSRLWCAAVQMANTAAGLIVSTPTSTSKAANENPGLSRRVFGSLQFAGLGELLHSLAHAEHMLWQVQMAASFKDWDEAVEVRSGM